MTLKQLRDAHAKNPDDADIAAQLAEKNYFLGKRKDAKELAEKVLKNMPRHPTAAYVKALTLMDEKRFEDAYSLLDSVATDDLKDTKPLKLLVKMQYDAKKFAQAARTCERARKIDPHDPTWIVQLGKLYVKTEQKDKLLEIFEEVAKVDPDDLTPRKVLAKHYLDLGKHAEAERYARMGLEIDVLDAECQRIIIEALAGLNRQGRGGSVAEDFWLVRTTPPQAFGNELGFRSTGAASSVVPSGLRCHHDLARTAKDDPRHLRRQGREPQASRARSCGSCRKSASWRRRCAAAPPKRRPTSSPTCSPGSRRWRTSRGRSR